MLQLLWNSIMFELRAVSKFFTGADGVITVLDTFSCTFEPGIAYGITGPSGAGKTTLLNLLIGIDAPSSGSIFLKETILHRWQPMLQKHMSSFCVLP